MRIFLFLFCFLCSVLVFGQNNDGSEIITLNNDTHTSSIKKVQFSPSGKYFCSIDNDNNVIVWETANQKVLTKIKGLDLVFSPRDTMFCVVSEVHTANLFSISDINTGFSFSSSKGKVKEKQTIGLNYKNDQSPKSCVSVQFDNTGRYLILQGDYSYLYDLDKDFDNAVKFPFEFEKGKIDTIQSFLARLQFAESEKYIQNDLFAYLYSAEDEAMGIIDLFNQRRGKVPIGKLDESSDTLYLSPTGRYCVVKYANNEAKLFGKIPTWERKNVLGMIHFFDNDQYIGYYQNEKGKVNLVIERYSKIFKQYIEMNKYPVEMTYKNKWDRHFPQFKIYKDLVFVQSLKSDGLVYENNIKVYLNHTKILRLNLDDRQLVDNELIMDFHPNGKQILVGDKLGNTYLVDLIYKTPQLSLKDPLNSSKFLAKRVSHTNNSVKEYALSPDKQKVAFVTNIGAYCLNTKDLKLTQIDTFFYSTDLGDLPLITFSPNGEKIIVMSKLNFRIWDVKNEKITGDIYHDFCLYECQYEIAVDKKDTLHCLVKGYGDNTKYKIFLGDTNCFGQNYVKNTQHFGFIKSKPRNERCNHKNCFISEKILEPTNGNFRFEPIQNKINQKTIAYRENYDVETNKRLSFDILGIYNSNKLVDSINLHINGEFKQIKPFDENMFAIFYQKIKLEKKIFRDQVNDEITIYENQGDKSVDIYKKIKNKWVKTDFSMYSIYLEILKKIVGFSEDGNLLIVESLNKSYLEEMTNFSGIEMEAHSLTEAKYWGKAVRKFHIWGRAFEKPIHQVNFYNDSMVVVSEQDSRIGFHNTKNEQSTWLSLDNEGNPIFKTTYDNYYYAPKSSKNSLHISYLGDVGSFKTYDMAFNRPDIIAERIGASKETVAGYKEIVNKRLKNTVVRNDTTLFQHLPKTNLLKAEEIPLFTMNEKETISLNFKDDLSDLTHYHVIVNGVPIYGVQGNAFSKASKMQRISLDIPLFIGENSIAIACTNSKGIRSMDKLLSIMKVSSEAKVKTYIIALGIDKYKGRLPELKYAVNDAQSVVKMYQDSIGKATEIDTFFNANATKTNLMQLRKKLLRTKPNDKIIVLLSGHGSAENSEFYFETQDEKERIAFDDIETLLDGIPALRKLVLIDACQSGRLDREEITAVAPKAQDNKTTQGNKGNLKTQDFNEDSLDPFARMLNIFNDIGYHSGTTVIAATSGKSSAKENSNLQHGFFSYAFLEAIKHQSADFNKDGSISIAELQKYIAAKVSDLGDTYGQQQYTDMRQENIEFNWSVW